MVSCTPKACLVPMIFSSRRRHPRGFVVLAPSLVLLMLLGSASWSDSFRVVKKVTDGDTVVLADGERVRLLAIDTPERGESLYHEAGALLSEFVLNQPVRLEFGKRRRDAYHRLLAYVWIHDTLVNERMLASGLARYYPWPDDSLHRDRLLKAQSFARRADLGLWALRPPEPESVYVIHVAHMRYHRPGCRTVRPEHRRMSVSREALLDSGWAACRTCKP